tara:strand:+ start:485 stop:772 length:288 start_codon:yes stop_codon:yes gene_type:complete
MTSEEILQKGIDDGMLTEAVIWKEIRNLARFPHDISWGEAMEFVVTVGDGYFEEPRERSVEIVLMDKLAIDPATPDSIWPKDGITYDHEHGIYPW